MEVSIAKPVPRTVEPLLAWPGLAGLRFSLPLAYLFFKIFISIYGGTSLLAELRGARESFHFAWELRLPFVPSLALVYLTVPLLLLLTPFILRTWRNFIPLFLTLTVETLVGGLFFLLLPRVQGYPAREAFGFGETVFRFADRLNLNYNEFPSLHIAFAVTVAIVFGRRCGWLGRILFALWVVAVGASTLLLHEHHLLDLSGGALLGLAAVAVVYRRTSDERVLEVLRIDGLCLREIMHHLRRHVRNLRPLAELFRASRGRWRETQVLRASWCLTRNVNDVLEGKRRVKGDPEDYIQAILRALRGGVALGESSGEQLAEFLAGVIGERERRELIERFEKAPRQRDTGS